jgi:DNA polymerase III delta prime subunit
LACNISTKIIEAIQSRAAILRYSRLSHEQILANLLKVCESEEVPYTDGKNSCALAPIMRRRILRTTYHHL